MLSKRDKVDGGLLRWVAFCGHKRVVQRLLEKGADIAGKNRFGRTALSWAAMKGHETVVELLLEKGADMKSRDANHGQTPLSWAAEHGHEAVVKLLLERGADVECRSRGGETPLWWAVGKGHEKSAPLLDPGPYQFPYQTQSSAYRGLRDRCLLVSTACRSTVLSRC